MPDCHVMVCHCCDRFETRQIRAELAKYNGAKPRQRARLVQTSWEDVVTATFAGVAGGQTRLCSGRKRSGPGRGGNGIVWSAAGSPVGPRSARMWTES
jgi:hypothetical protein